MLDKKFILANLDAVRANVAARHMHVDLNRFAVLADQRKHAEQRLHELNREANEISARIAKERDRADEALTARARAVRDEIAESRAALELIQREYDELHSAIPNMTDPRAPLGQTDTANVVLSYGSTPRPSFDFAPKDHLTLGEALNLLDMEGGSRVAGHGFYYLKNQAVLLDLALQRYALSVLQANNFELVATPDVARRSIISGTGYSPRGNETQIYTIESSDLGLIATSEITLCGLYADVTLDMADLPLKLAGVSHCFRTEAGAHGRASRGLYRVHQFSKVEMFAFTTAELSDEMHLHLLEIEKQIFDGLGIPFRVVENATGDLGAAAYRKFDLEAWMPGRGRSGEWGEVTSASNCTDYQARRLGIRYRDASGKKAFAHTLNGTAIATSRALIAIMENYQRADGSIALPDALRPLLDFDVIPARPLRPQPSAPSAS